jgi:hypothetical protein
MAAGQQTHQRLADLQVLADNDLADLAGNGVDFGEHGSSGKYKVVNEMLFILLLMKRKLRFPTVQSK